jgi:hypothetical protein
VTPQDLIRIIEEDLAHAADSLVWHGRPLKSCLQVPRRIRVLNSHNNDEAEELWFVFEEGPNPGEGYKVVYDEDVNMFGLAVNGIKEPVLIGLYGGFMETLNSM